MIFGQKWVALATFEVAILGDLSNDKFIIIGQVNFLRLFKVDKCIRLFEFEAGTHFTELDFEHLWQICE